MENTITPPLLTPYKMGDLELKNRAVMAALTRRRGDPETGVANDLHVEYYSKRASDAGLILTECSAIRKDGDAFPGSVRPLRRCRGTRPRHDSLLADHPSAARTGTHGHDRPVDRAGLDDLPPAPVHGAGAGSDPGGLGPLRDGGLEDRRRVRLRRIVLHRRRLPRHAGRDQDQRSDR